MRGVEEGGYVQVECTGEGEHGEEAGFDGSSGFEGTDSPDGDVGSLSKFLLAESFALAGRLEGRSQLTRLIAISAGVATCPVRHPVNATTVALLL